MEDLIQRIDAWRDTTRNAPMLCGIESVFNGYIELEKRYDTTIIDIVDNDILDTAKILNDEGFDPLV